MRSHYDRQKCHVDVVSLDNGDPNVAGVERVHVGRRRPGAWRNDFSIVHGVSLDNARCTHDGPKPREHMAKKTGNGAGFLPILGWDVADPSCVERGYARPLAVQS